MGTFRFILSLLLLLFCLHGQSLASTGSQVSSIQSIAKVVIGSLPDSGLRDGLQRYLEILNPDRYQSDASVGIDNSGLALHFQNQFQRDTCFAKKTLHFYRDLRTSVTGENPGWLFERAMSVTHRNPWAALNLIGVCGHDNIRQGVFENATALQDLAQEGWRREDFYQPLTGVDTQTDSFCPSKESPFFGSDSLGRNVDISSSLKNRILSVQFPHKKWDEIPAKNYHILGAAFMTCQMIEAGMNPWVAIQVQTTAAGLYRGIRLCQSIDKPSQLFLRLQRHPEIRKNFFRRSFEENIITEALARGKNKLCSVQKNQDDALCDLLQSVGAPFDLSIPRLEERARQLLQKYMDTLIASGLYSQWHFGGNYAGVNLPCSGQPWTGPHPMLKWLFERGTISINVCGAGITPESCKKALQRISSWELDFQWTQAQHKVGAQFAATHCRHNPEPKKIENIFCKK